MGRKVKEYKTFEELNNDPLIQGFTLTEKDAWHSKYKDSKGKEYTLVFNDLAGGALTVADLFEPAIKAKIEPLTEKMIEEMIMQHFILKQKKRGK